MGGGKGGGGGNDYGSMMAAIASMQAAQLQYQLGIQQLDWAKDVYNQNYPYIQQGAEQSLAAQKQANEFATSQMDFYNQQYKPLEQKYLGEAQQWGNLQNQQEQAGYAQEMVADQFTQARNAAAQQLESFGVDPTSTRYAALDLGSRTQQAAAEAGAGTAAIQNRQMQGMQLESGAINTGRGYANTVPATFGTAGGLGAGAAGSLTNFFGTGAQAQNGADVWFQSGNQAMGNAVNAYNNYYKNSYPERQQSGSSGIGAGLGLIGGILQAIDDGGPVLDNPQAALPAPGGALPATGHVVPAAASPSGGRDTDDVQARVNVGEFVVPRDVVSWLGEKEMYKLIQKSKEDRSKVEQETTAKPAALPALPGPTRYESPGAAKNYALPT